jgi:DNA-binding transcriptional regulator GbsR (MarR family)
MKEITVIQFAEMLGISKSSFKQKRRAGINGWELCPKVIGKKARADLFDAEKAQEFKEIMIKLAEKPKSPRNTRITISYSGDALERIIFLQPKLRVAA